MPMANRGNTPEPPRVEGTEDNFGHPRGTLAIMIVFAALFMLAWLATYVCVFLERGAPHS
jgi:Cytochrome c oxidase subunit IIa family